MKVMIIPEDFTKDQYMLKPIIEAMMKAIGRSNPTVRVCHDPRFHSVNQVLDWARLGPVIDRYRGLYDLILICVDRDGYEGRRASLDEIERRAKESAPNCIVFGENAWQEIEVWVLAGHTLLKGWKWDAIRREVHPKETYYLPFAEQRGVQEQPAEGRKTLAEEAARRYKNLRKRCPEDIVALETRIAEKLKQP